MGIKSTVYLSRADVIDKAARIMLEKEEEKVKAILGLYDNTQLEDLLEDLNDSLYESGSGFENYIINEE